MTPNRPRKIPLWDAGGGSAEAVGPGAAEGWCIGSPASDEVGSGADPFGEEWFSVGGDGAETGGVSAATGGAAAAGGPTEDAGGGRSNGIGCTDAGSGGVSGAPIGA